MGTDAPQSQDQTGKKVEIPEGAIEIREVQYSWLWRPIWGIVALLAAFSFAIIPDPISLSFLIILILLPYYFYSRRTRYHLTEESLFYQPGYVWKSAGPFELPFARIKQTGVAYGLFGRALGYQHVKLGFDNGATAVLKFIPMEFDVLKYLNERISEEDAPAPPAETEPQALEDESENAE